MTLNLTQRFRRQVAPYNVVQSLAAMAGSSYCPALQTILPSGLPNIDRASCPTVLQAVVSASSPDNSGSVSSVTDSAVTNIKWMVQKGDESAGTDITLHSAWTGLFTVGTGADKGKLTIRMNIPAGTTWKIWMECVIADQRTGTTRPIEIVTDSVLLYSIADASDMYTMSIDRPSGELYEPARDQRLLHEYLTWMGEAHTLDDDGNTYLRTVTAALRKGGTPMASADYSVKVFSIDAVGTRAEVTAANDDCISAISGQSITFDLRFATERTYQIACYVGTAEVGHKTYGWAWSGEMPTTDEGIVGGATYADGDEQTFRVKLNLGKGMLLYPEIAYRMLWYYRQPGQAQKVYVGAGRQHTYDLGASAMFLNGEAEAVLEIDKRGAYHFLTDENGNMLTDENGNYLIEH